MANKAFYNKKGSIPITDEYWERLVKHFIENASDTLILNNQKTLAEQNFFVIEHIDNICKTPVVTALHFDNQKKALWCACEWDLHKYNIKTKALENFKNMGVITAISTERDDKIQF